MKIRTNIDTLSCKRKPSGLDIGGISNRTRRAEAVKEIELDELFTLVISGHTFTPAELNGPSKSNWQSQQLLCIDIDNEATVTAPDGRPITGENGKPVTAPLPQPTTPEFAHQLTRNYGLSACLIYQTFSSTNELPRFRMVFCLDKPLTDVNAAMNYTRRLAGIIPGADPAIATPERMIFGTTQDKLVCKDAAARITEDALRKLPPAPLPVAQIPERPQQPAPARTESDSDLSPVLEEIRSRWMDAYTPARDRKGIVCPLCGHGSNGDGIVHDPHSSDPYGLHCFTCGFSGDIIRLRQTDKKLEFIPAVKDLAQQFNIPLPEYKKKEPETSRAAAAEPEVQKPMTEDEKAADRENYLLTASSAQMDAFRAEILRNTSCPAVSTGFDSIDRIMDGGLYPELIILGAISSLGKTTLFTQIADNIAQSGRDVLIFSLEMGRHELMAKSISRQSLSIAIERTGRTQDAKTVRGVLDGSKWATQYSPAEKEILEASMNTYAGYADHIFIQEGIGDIGVKHIRAAIEKHMEYTGREPVVFIDYLQILAPYNERYSDKQNTDKAVMELKRISRDYRLPVVAISSFNRGNYNGPVKMEAFKESGSIEYSADTLIGLQLPGIKGTSSEEEIAAAKQRNPRPVELVILKQRNGQIGGKANLLYYPMFNTFKED